VRVVNRILAAALALALLVGGLLVALEIVVAGFGADPLVLPHDQWYDAGRGNDWNSPASRWSFMAVTAVGLALLLLRLAQRRPETLRLPASEGGATAEVWRRSLERSLERAARRVDGVASARARLFRSKARIVARADQLATDTLEPAIAEVARTHLRSLGLPQNEVAVRVREGKRP
jgi:hypothetical protein